MRTSPLLPSRNEHCRGRPRLSRRGALLAGLGAALALPGCGIGGALPAGFSPDASPVLRDISYGPSRDNHLLDLHIPRGAPPAGGWPVVVHFHGGYWLGGNRADWLTRGYVRRLTERGVMVASANYRVFPDVSFPGFVEDGALAVAWAARHARDHGGNPDLLFSSGFSAGALISVLLAVDPGYLEPHRIQLAGGIGIAGPYGDWFQNHETTRDIFPVGLRRRSSAIAMADGRNAPLLLLAGTFDVIVRSADTPELAAKVRAAGGHAEDRRYGGTGHVDIVVGNDTVADEVAGFVRRMSTARIRYAGTVAQGG